jgi:hypothetical protein
VEECSDEVAQGGVISQEPAAGTMVAPGSVVTLTVSTGPCNNPPVANAGPDQADKSLGDVQLDGSGSYDVDGNEITYSWTIEDEPYMGAAELSNPSAVRPVLTIYEYGSYTIELIVNDGLVDSAPDPVVISTHENLPPMANAGGDQTVYSYNQVCLDGSGSSDPNGDEITYSWSFESRPDGSEAELDNPNDVDPCFVPDIEGDYVAQLVVNDGRLDSDPDTVTIGVEVNVRPIAEAGPDQTVLVGEPANLDGNGSNDPDGDEINCTWSIISKPDTSAAYLDNPTGLTTFFVPDKAGDYVVQLIVRDEEYDSEPDTLVVTALEEGCYLPGDIDGDCDVDRDDLNILLAARNTPADGPDDPRDLDGDGVITVLDARRLVLLCTRPACATE